MPRSCVAGECSVRRKAPVRACEDRPEHSRFLAEMGAPTRCWARFPAVAFAMPLVALALALAAVATPAARAAQASTTASAGAPAQTHPTLAELEGQVANLKQQTDNLDSFVNQLLLPLSILVGLLAGGGVIGLITSIRYERRQAQLHDLSMAGERSSQGRAEQMHSAFLASSKETLGLVNDTLNLAKQASERAAEAMEQKARDSLNDIDTQAKDVLDRAFITRDFKVLVENQDTRTELDEIANTLTPIEGYVHLQGMTLTPRCFFVKGVQRHLRAESEAAIRNFRAAQTADDPELRTWALYWAAYELNNLGRYSEAQNSFRGAQEHVGQNTPQGYELRRMQLEATFFGRVAAQESPEELRGATRDQLVGDLEAELERLAATLPENADFQSERKLYSLSRGNLLLWRARVSPAERDTEGECDERERELLGQAIHHFEQAGALTWAQFGRMQARWALSEVPDPAECEALRKAMRDQVGRRREWRTRALLHASILILDAEQRGAEDMLDADERDLRNVMQHVHEAMTLYSPWQKRNVRRDEFEREVHAYELRRSGEATPA